MQLLRFLAFLVGGFFFLGVSWIWPLGRFFDLVCAGEASVGCWGSSSLLSITCRFPSWVKMMLLFKSVF